MPATQAFVLMNLDLIAVPLQVGGAAFTVYCGSRRASELLAADADQQPAEPPVNRSRDAAELRQGPGRRSARHATAPVDRR